MKSVLMDLSRSAALDVMKVTKVVAPECRQ